MFITVLQRDVFQQAIKDLKCRYAGYTLARVSEKWSESDNVALIEQGVWHGYYERLSVVWSFELEKLSQDYKGPDRMSVLINPVFDIVFADIYPNVFHIEVGFDGFPDIDSRPTLYTSKDIKGSIWDVHYFYDASLRDL